MENDSYNLLIAPFWLLKNDGVFFFLVWFDRCGSPIMRKRQTIAALEIT